MKRFEFTALIHTAIGAEGTIRYPAFVVNGTYVVTAGDKRVIGNSPSDLMEKIASELQIEFLEYNAPESCIVFTTTNTSSNL